jgi:hypothetical protein
MNEKILQSDNNANRALMVFFTLLHIVYYLKKYILIINSLIEVRYYSALNASAFFPNFFYYSYF